MREETKSTIKNFVDLEAWKQSKKLAVDIYTLTKKFPKEEMFGLVSQMRRAAVSVPSNIAEGFSREFPKEKTQFYAIAKGSLTELHTQVLIARDVGYLSASECGTLGSNIEQTNKLLTGLLKYTRNLS